MPNKTKKKKNSKRNRTNLIMSTESAEKVPSLSLVWSASVLLPQYSNNIWEHAFLDFLLIIKTKILH